MTLKTIVISYGAHRFQREHRADRGSDRQSRRRLAMADP